MSQFILMSIGSYSTKYTNKFISTRKTAQILENISKTPRRYQLKGG